MHRAYQILSLLIATVAIGVAGFAVRSNVKTVHRLDETVQALKRESVVRRDQQCLVFERFGEQAISAFQAAQAQLANTLDYLAKTPPAERGTQLNQAIKANVPQLQVEIIQRWKEAKAAKAPPYCDKPNVGLPEPNLRLPPKPRFSP